MCKLLLLFLWFPCSLLAQNTIQIYNSSFEGHAEVGFSDNWWNNCEKTSRSTPDLHGGKITFFDVTEKPYDGETYLGLVVRDDNTNESISQELSLPLIPGMWHNFSIQARKSSGYKSASPTTKLPVKYDSPVILVIYGGYDYCDLTESLYTTELLNFESWNEVKISLKPKKAYTHITIQAEHLNLNLPAYNGNVLLDDISSINISYYQTSGIKLDIENYSIDSIIHNFKFRVDSFESKPAPESELAFKINITLLGIDFLNSIEEANLVQVCQNNESINTYLDALEQLNAKTEVFFAKKIIEVQFKSISEDAKVEMSIQLQEEYYKKENVSLKIAEYIIYNLPEIIGPLKQTWLH